MKNLPSVAAGLALVLFCGCALGAAPASAQGYPPALSQTMPAAPPYAPMPDNGPKVWQYNPNASNYAPGGSTGYAPYSQDEMNTVVHDGSNGRR
jgi:hypothetical protein